MTGIIGGYRAKMTCWSALVAAVLGGACFACSAEQELRPSDPSGSEQEDAASAHSCRPSDAGVALVDAQPSVTTDSTNTQSTTDTSPALPPMTFADCATITGEALDPEIPWAQCASVPLPLLHQDPALGSIEVFIKKLPAAKPELKRGSLWLLQGGPGISGASLEWLATSLHDELPDLDIVIPDHRGVGRSTFFECDMVRATSTAEFLRGCASELASEWGDGTRGFTITEAARDVLAMASHLRQAPNEQVLLWGASYGGTWVHRVLQLDNTRVVTGAVIDSGGVYLREGTVEDTMLERAEAGDVLFAECALNEECRKRLGDAPKERALAIMNNLCDPLNDAQHGRRWLQESLTRALDRWRSLRLIPAILYRAERCTPEDVTFIENYFEEAGDYGAPPVTLSAKNSDAVLLHILASEIMPNPTSLERLDQAADEAVFADRARYTQFDGLHDFWPVYPIDEYMGEFASVETPTLILHGGLDSRTPPRMGRALAEHFKAPAHQFFYFPLGTHGVYSGSHDAFPEEPNTEATDAGADAGDAGAEPDRLSCGAHLTLQFLREPTRAVDATCLDEAPALEFTASDEFLEAIAGHKDVWDNPE